MTANRLSPEDSRAKAAECRALARQALRQEHRIMLEHIAETWDRIASELEESAMLPIDFPSG
jgi:hypothetical protein